jgi:hypothetical protein
MSVGNFVIGAILIAIGIWFVIKAYWFNHQVFFLGWAEKKWGPGSGTTAYRFIGFGACVLGMFCIMGIVDIYGTAFGGKSSNSQTLKRGVSPSAPRINARNGEIAP